MPVAVCNIGLAEDPHIDAVDFGVIAAAKVARFQTSMKPITGQLERTEMKCRNSREMIRLDEQCRARAEKQGFTITLER
jgi:hypothetical protein